MARIGPSGMSHAIDAWDPSANTVSAAATLSGITEFSGINEEGQFVDLMAYGQAHRGEIPAGISSFQRIDIGGFVDAQSAGTLVTTSALAVLRGGTSGRIANQAGDAARTYTVTYATGLTESLECRVAMASIVPSPEGPQMWRAQLASAATAAADHTTTGF